MALTLVEAAKSAMDAGETKKAAVIEMFAENSDILDAFVWDDIAGNALKYDQEASLPGVAFRGVNESYTPSTGVINPQTESLFIAGGDLDVDTFIVKTQGTQARTRQEKMKVKSLSAAITDTIINGDSTGDPREFDGLQRRITGGQRIHNSAASDGAVLSLYNLDALIDLVDGPTHLIMNREMKRRFITATRDTGVSGFITQDKDGQGRPIVRYNDLPILTGYKQNRNTAILPFEEAFNGGGTAVGTSIYCVKFATDGVCGIQNGGMDVRDMGELQTEPKWRTRVEWFPGMALYSGFAAARLDSIKSGAIVK
jgi:hypothetical protein